MCQRKLLCLLATISSNERNKKQTFECSEFVLVKHPLLKTGRNSYLYNFLWNLVLLLRAYSVFLESFKRYLTNVLAKQPCKWSLWFPGLPIAVSNDKSIMRRSERVREALTGDWLPQPVFDP